jgi:hypothetical protein
VEGGKQETPFAGERDQRIGFGHGDGDGLVDDDMLAGLERRPWRAGNAGRSASR